MNYNHCCCSLGSPVAQYISLPGMWLSWTWNQVTGGSEEGGAHALAAWEGWKAGWGLWLCPGIQMFMSLVVAGAM